MHPTLHALLPLCRSLLHPQALNDTKARLASLSGQGGQLRAQLASRRAELAGFESQLATTQQQAVRVERSLGRLKAEGVDV